MLDDPGRGAALAAAMRLFWERGIADAAYPAIVAATGLNRKTLYRHWPDKAALVREALALYRAQELDPMLAILGGGGAAALSGFWTEAEARARRAGRQGCLLLRAAAEGDAVERRMSEDWLDALTGALATAIISAVRDLPRSRVLDADAAAWQSAGLLVLASKLSAGRGYDARVAGLFRAGRLACGLPPG